MEKYLITLKKYHDCGEVMQHVRKCMRRFSDGDKTGTNIFASMTKYNYSIASHGASCAEISLYMEKVEREIFCLKRKDIVHGVEWVFKKPEEIPITQEKEYFQAAYDFVIDKLPMGEKCVLVSEVHKDEWVRGSDKKPKIVPHLHILFIPAVPDMENSVFAWRLQAASFTKLRSLYEMQHGFWPFLKKRGIEYSIDKNSECDSAPAHDGNDVKNNKKQNDRKGGSVMDISKDTATSPGKKNEKKASLTINGKALKQALEKRSLPLNRASKEIGYNSNYITIAAKRGRISAEAAAKLNDTYNIRLKEYDEADEENEDMGTMKKKIQGRHHGLPIDKDMLTQTLKNRGLTMANISVSIGRYSNYLSNAKLNGYIDPEAARRIEEIYGIRYEEYASRSDNSVEEHDIFWKVDSRALQEALGKRGLTMKFASMAMGYNHSYIESMAKTGAVNQGIKDKLEKMYGIRYEEYVQVSEERKSAKEASDDEKSGSSVHGGGGNTIIFSGATQGTSALIKALENNTAAVSKLAVLESTEKKIAAPPAGQPVPDYKGLIAAIEDNTSQTAELMERIDELIMAVKGMQTNTAKSRSAMESVQASAAEGIKYLKKQSDIAEKDSEKLDFLSNIKYAIGNTNAKLDEVKGEFAKIGGKHDKIIKTLTDIGRSITYLFPGRKSA